MLNLLGSWNKKGGWGAALWLVFCVSLKLAAGERVIISDSPDRESSFRIGGDNRSATRISPPIMSWQRLLRSSQPSLEPVPDLPLVMPEQGNVLDPKQMRSIELKRNWIFMTPEDLLPSEEDKLNSQDNMKEGLMLQGDSTQLQGTQPGRRFLVDYVNRLERSESQEYASKAQLSPQLQQSAPALNPHSERSLSTTSARHLEGELSTLPAGEPTQAFYGSLNPLDPAPLATPGLSFNSPAGISGPLLNAFGAEEGRLGSLQADQARHGALKPLLSPVANPVHDPVASLDPISRLRDPTRQELNPVQPAGTESRVVGLLDSVSPSMGGVPETLSVNRVIAVPGPAASLPGGFPNLESGRTAPLNGSPRQPLKTVPTRLEPPARPF